MRRLLALLLVTVLLISIGHLSEAAPAGWATQEIEKAKKYGFIDEGMPSDYRDYITREGFCELAVRLFSALTGNDVPLPDANPFKDTDNPLIIKAYTLGIIRGVSNDNFAPNDHITREQIAVMIYRLMKAINPAVIDGRYPLSFKDGNKISPWAVEAVACTASKGVMRGVDRNIFMPDAPVTWEQAIAIAVRVYDLLKTFLPLEELSPNNYAFKVYRSSNFPEDHLEMKINSPDSIEVSGKTLLDKRYLWFQIKSESGQPVIDDFETVKEDGSFAFKVSTKNLPEGQYKVNVYINDKRYGYYEAIFWDIPMSKSEAGLFFPASPIYANNVSKFSDIILPTPNHLSLQQYSEEERKELYNLATEITQGKGNDYEKAFAICDWVSDNIYYDYDAYYNRSTTQTDAIGVLRTKRSVCEGYAELTAALLRAIGIPARIVRGHALGIDANGRYWDSVDHSVINHAWNEIFIDGRWIIVDTTWNSKNEYRNGQYIYKGRRYRFFDATIEALSHTHKIMVRQ